MKAFKNIDGTYNVYDFTSEKYVVVSKDFFHNVDLRLVVDAEIHFGSSSNELKITYKDGSSVFYKNVHGSWGMPYKIV